ncbi:hypothetical protein BH24ACT6_BH24ACT6_12830 [soil metagenome]
MNTPMQPPPFQPQGGQNPPQPYGGSQRFGGPGPPQRGNNNRGPWIFLSVLIVAVAAVLGGIIVFGGDGSAAEPTDPTTDPTTEVTTDPTTDPTTPPTEPDDDADEAIESLEGAFAALRAGDCDAVVEHFTEEFLEREFSDCDGFLGETDLDYTRPTVLSANPMRLETNVSFGSEGIDMQFELVERKGDWLINQVDADTGGPDATTVTNVEPTCEEGGLTAVTSDCD